MTRTRTDCDMKTRAASRVRRPGDVMRLIVALAVVVGAQLLAALAHVGVRTTERALLDSVVTLPPLLRDSLTGAAQLVLVLAPAAMIVAVAAGGRFALVARLLIAGGAGSPFASSTHICCSVTPIPRCGRSCWPGGAGCSRVTFPPVAWLSGATAVVTVCGPELSRRWRSGLWWLTATAAAIEVTVGGFLPVDAAVAAALGVTVGCVVLLAFGEPASRPAASRVAVALQECGVELKSLTELPPPPQGPAAFAATTVDGTLLAVRVYAADDRDRDRLATALCVGLIAAAEPIVQGDYPHTRLGRGVEEVVEVDLFPRQIHPRQGPESLRGLA